MTKHTIPITIDVPDEMLASVHDAAHKAIGLIREHVMAELSTTNRLVTMLKDDPTSTEVVAVCKEYAERISASFNEVGRALSEITHTMNDANSEWLRSKSATVARKDE